MLSSILDNDFYKFTMQQGVLRLFPNSKARYKFINRGKHRFPDGFADLLKDAIKQMAGLRLTQAEKAFLKAKCPYLDRSYLDFLEGYTYDPEEVNVEQQGTDLRVEIEGFWFRSILWEVPLMALICELYYLTNNLQPSAWQEIITCAHDKIERYSKLGVTVADFGTRRRFSYAVHKLVVETFRKSGSPYYVGTSNVHLAMLDGSSPIGTHAHEWFMFHAAKYGFNRANHSALENWVKVYRGDLGIALSDTYTTDVFFRQFDKMFSKLFDGVRHDSGDPLQFADKVIRHYQDLGIDPRTKTIIFSDALNYDKIARIQEHCAGRIKTSYGIGTNLTNDVGQKPLNIVIKMIAAEAMPNSWTGTVKLSDEPGKFTGSEEMIRLATATLNIDN